MVLLILLPFYDRGPERRPERRPIATTAGILVIFAMAYLTYLGAAAGSPTEIEIAAPKSAGGETKLQRKLVAAQSGCLACHKFKENGNDGPGPNLTKIGSRVPRRRSRARCEPHGADAVLQGPAAGEVQQPRRLPLAAEVGVAL